MRFNFLASKKKQTLNYEGATAWKIGPAAELYAAVVTSSLSNTFYEGADQRLERIRSLVGQNDPLFVAKLAVYARTNMHLHSVPLVLCVELAKVQKGDDLVSRMVSGVIHRADEITELLAYYQLSIERSGTKKLNRLSKQLQKGLALAFLKFDEYQFAKYNRIAEVKLRDALFLVHPKSQTKGQKDKRSCLIKLRPIHWRYPTPGKQNFPLWDNCLLKVQKQKWLLSRQNGRS